jgi:putative SbcD/Mre11-related phosphoesterase
MSTVHGDWRLTPYRAAVHVPTATAVAADVHLGYDDARVRGGDAVPVRSLDRTLADLAALASVYAVRRLVVGGDLVENRAGRARLADFRTWLARVRIALTAVVPGNHDRSLSGDDLPLFREGFEVGGWRVAHGDGPLPGGRVVLGHFHPCLRWLGRYAAPCYLVGDDRIVLPAFSQDAAGVNVLRRQAWQGCECHVIVAGRVLAFARVADLRRGAAASELRSGVRLTS